MIPEVGAELVLNRQVAVVLDTILRKICKPIDNQGQPIFQKLLDLQRPGNVGFAEPKSCMGRGAFFQPPLRANSKPNSMSNS